MKLSKVTMTGADDSIYPSQLNQLSIKYPYVEWGLLLSAKSEGKNRFPTLSWMEDLKGLENNIQLSGHLCGEWTRDLLVGKNSFVSERPTIFDLFQRFQLNFHAEDLLVKPDAFMQSVKSLSRGREIIFQLDKVNNALIVPFVNKNMYVSGLHDASHGTGALTTNWPRYIAGINNGYAGGLSPENIVEQLEKIESVVGDKEIWIDAETMLRSNNDKQFDLEKIEEFLQKCKPWIK